MLKVTRFLPVFKPIVTPADQTGTNQTTWLWSVALQWFHWIDSLLWEIPLYYIYIYIWNPSLVLWGKWLLRQSGSKWNEISFIIHLMLMPVKIVRTSLLLVWSSLASSRRLCSWRVTSALEASSSPLQELNSEGLFWSSSDGKPVVPSDEVTANSTASSNSTLRLHVFFFPPTLWPHKSWFKN